MSAGTQHEKNRKAAFTVVGLGEILWDMLPDGKQLGGAPANFAYHAHALGAESFVASCVGNDPLGREIFERVKALGLDSSYIATDNAHPTGTVDVEVDADGKPRYVIHENVAWDFIPAGSALLELAARADAVCFGSLCQRSKASRETIRRFLRATRPDCLRVFDINFRQSYYSAGVVKESLQSASVLKLNEEELPVIAQLLEGVHPAELLEAFNASLDLIALTKGSEGSVLITSELSSIQPGAEVEVADTVGAGDAFTAALVMGLLRGDDLDKINASAGRLAGYVCSQRGATPEVPSEVLESL